MAFWNRKKKDFAETKPAKNPFDEIIEKYGSQSLKLTNGIVVAYEQDDSICYQMDFEHEAFVQFVVDKYQSVTFNIGDGSGEYLTFGMSKGGSVFKIYDGKLRNKKFAEDSVAQLLQHYFQENNGQFSIDNLGNYAGIDGL